MKFDDIETAFMFVSEGRPFENAAYVDKKTGKIYYRSDYGIDEFQDEGLSEDDIEWDDFADIPHKNDLDLGQQLIWDFVDMKILQHYNKVRGFFFEKGGLFQV